MTDSRDRRSAPTRSPEPPQPPDIRTRIANALAILRAFAGAQSGTVRRHVELATETIEAAERALADFDELIDSVTDSDVDAARALVDAREELRRRSERIATLEAELAQARAEIDAERTIQDEERRRLRDLERKSKTFDETLASDPAAFDAFMERALDSDPRTRGDERRKR